MEEIKIAQAIDKSFSQFCKAFSGPGSRNNKENGYSWNDNYGGLWPTCIYDVVFEEGSIDTLMNEIIYGIKESRLPNFLVTDSSKHPSNIDSVLESYGFNMVREALGMAIHLNELNEIKYNDEVYVRAITDINDLAKWSEIVTLNMYGKSPNSTSNLLEIVSQIDSNEFKFFMAYIDDKPVATSCLFVKDGIAGIYQVATIEEYRNRGIGKEITMAPLKLAKDMGMEIAVLHASQLGTYIYKTIGFKEYSKLGRYVYSNL